MGKIVYNGCYGGFGLSKKAWDMYKSRTESAYGAKAVASSQWEIDRQDPILVEVIEELGRKANGPHADLHIRELSPGTRYRIEEYDGWETVETPDDIEWNVVNE